MKIPMLLVSQLKTILNNFKINGVPCSLYKWVHFPGLFLDRLETWPDPAKSIKAATVWRFIEGHWQIGRDCEEKDWGPKSKKGPVKNRQKYN